MASGAVGLVASMRPRRQDEPSAQAPEPHGWFELLWAGRHAADLCEVGVRGRPGVAARRLVVTAVDLPMADGALSIERVWTGERGGLSAWVESVWTSKGRRSTGRAASATRSNHQHRARPCDWRTARRAAGRRRRIDQLCPDGARCVSADRTADSIVLTAERMVTPASTVTIDDRGPGGQPATGRDLLVHERTADGRRRVGDHLLRLRGRPPHPGGDRGDRTFDYDAGRVTSTVDGDRGPGRSGRRATSRSPRRVDLHLPLEDGVLLEVEDASWVARVGTCRAVGWSPTPGRSTACPPGFSMMGRSAPRSGPTLPTGRRGRWTARVG
jgi:hypothetical protein